MGCNAKRRRGSKRAAGGAGGWWQLRTNSGAVQGAHAQRTWRVGGRCRSPAGPSWCSVAPIHSCTPNWGAPASTCIGAARLGGWVWGLFWRVADTDDPHPPSLRRSGAMPSSSSMAEDRLTADLDDIQPISLGAPAEEAAPGEDAAPEETPETPSASWIADGDEASGGPDWTEIQRARLEVLELSQQQAAGEGEAAEAAPAEEQLDVRFEDGQVSAAGLDWENLPPALGEQYGAEATKLELSYNMLSRLEGLDKFVELQELVLDNNEIGDDVLAEFPSLPKLHTLSLNKNNLQNLELWIDHIKTALPSLSYLSLLGNLACPNELVQKDEGDYTRYRYAVLNKLPNLRFLDSRPVSQAELAEAQRVGAYVKVVKFDYDAFEKEELAKAKPSSPGKKPAFSPLPQSSRTAENPRATLSQCKYVYYGRHSEGNRFIRNNDL
eukprot:m.4997 g.4997  ORF g.4997 m.4997 type:complete len:438 (+) comp2475_c0_seq1:220-1533(+)